MTDIVKGMATAHTNGLWAGGSREAAMRAALMWLADNVSDEMVFHLIGETFKHRPPAFKFEYTVDQTRNAIAAAIRAAAGEEGK